jgi:hypothetical protein
MEGTPSVMSVSFNSFGFCMKAIRQCWYHFAMQHDAGVWVEDATVELPEADGTVLRNFLRTAHT